MPRSYAFTSGPRRVPTDVEPDPRSHWLERADGPTRPLDPVATAAEVASALRHADVAVLGAGMAGVLTALALVEDGAVVALLDAGEVAARTTGRSTAKVTALHGAVYHRLRHGKGAEAAACYAEANQAGVDEIASIAERLGIDCDLRSAIAYTCASTADGDRTIEQELEAAAEAGLPVEIVATTDLPLRVTSAVALAGQYQFDPVAFARGVVGQLHERGVRVLSGVRVTSVGENRHGCTIEVDGDEHPVPHAVLTTHLPISDPSLLAGRVRPERSYAVAGPTSVGLDTEMLGMYLSIDEGWSVRSVGPSQPGWLVVGGEGHAMVDHVETADHHAALRRFAEGSLGVDVRSAWSAFDHVTTDGVPFIGALAPGSDRRSTACGFAKWGMSTSAVAARLIADRIAGRENPAAALFDASRILPTVSRDLVSNNARVAARFVGDRLTARPTSGHVPAPGEGVVVREGARWTAVSCDRSGTVRRLDATCTHLGCVVRFDAGEQVWDCPCHGSRFTLEGSVLDGPATAPLSSRDAEEA